MEDFTRSVLILLSVIFSVAGDTVHLTMVTPTPYGAGSSSASISCFRSSPDDDVTLSFGRPFPIALQGSTIQASTTLPAGSTESVNGQIVTQDLTTSNDATGLLYCEGSSRGLTTRVYSIIHSVYRKFEPLDGLVTRTINAGEGVTLTVTSVNGGNDHRWRRIRNGTRTSLDSYNGMYTVTFPSSVVSDRDLFATIQSALPLGDNHFSMIRVIVRGCAAGKWGPPDCAGVCDMCYNGGVCDDKTGDCICAPGFMGPNCLSACGMHGFGWYCTFRCGPGNVIQSCTESQFGLPDPYGNSCISGYRGRDCNVVCSAGLFGAGCTQTCHCESGQCNAYTGQCTGSPSGCQTGWSGTNCQIPDVCPVGYYGDECLNKCHCLNDAACDKATGYCSGSNGVCATGFQCVSNSGACSAGLYWLDAGCNGHCHCLNNAACDPSSLYCVGSDGECEEGFHTDRGTNNCQLGITEFQATKVNPGQRVPITCAGSSGFVLSASEIILSISADGSGPTFSSTSDTYVSKELTNTFSIPGLQPGQTIYCILTSAGLESIQSLTVEFYVLPMLSLVPSVSVTSTSATVSWQRWGTNAMDTGDGPVIEYRVYYSLTPTLSWITAGYVTAWSYKKLHGNSHKPIAGRVQLHYSIFATRYTIYIQRVYIERGEKGKGVQRYLEEHL